MRSPSSAGRALEARRQRLEGGVESRGRRLFPATFMLVFANTRCPCEHYGDAARALTATCRVTPIVQ